MSFVAGAKKMLEELKQYVESPKKPKGPAEFVFNRAVEAFGGVRYRAEHGGYELSNADGIKVLEVWDKIVGAVSLVYDCNGEKGRRVLELMEKSKKIAGPLLTISRIIKSQQKITGERLAELKRCLRLFSIAWRQGFPARGVWLKFHRLEHHIIQFIELFGMVGRVSEEGFESFHPLMNSLFNDGKSIVSTRHRVNCMGRKLHSGANADVQKIMVQVKDATSRPKKGPNRNTAAKRMGEHGGDLVSSVLEEDEAGEYLIISEREMIPKAWQDLFLLLTHNKAPREWSRVFRDHENLGEEIKVKLEYCSQ
jgi:hypothetical protein